MSQSPDSSLLPTKETRREGDFVGCVFCSQSVAHLNVIRCVMCMEPRHARPKCLQLPVNEENVMPMYGFNGASVFICFRCARHISLSKDTVVSRMAMSNGIVNATKVSEERAELLEKQLLEEQNNYQREKAAWNEERERLMHAVQRKRAKYSKYVDVEYVKNMEKASKNLVSEIKKTLEFVRSECKQKKRSKNDSSSSSSSGSSRSSDDESGDNSQSETVKSTVMAVNSEERVIAAPNVAQPQLSDVSSEDESTGKDKCTPSRVNNKENGTYIPIDGGQNFQATNNDEYDPCFPQFNRNEVPKTPMHSFPDTGQYLDISNQYGGNVEEVVQQLDSDNGLIGQDFDWNLTF